ncbi:MAG: hypothetical protein VKJ04_11855 [Vampirovibrionales bacterium]|nr:hypothetical protein [Vampirovibrionales bacterium]
MSVNLGGNGALIVTGFQGFPEGKNLKTDKDALNSEMLRAGYRGISTSDRSDEILYLPPLPSMFYFLYTQRVPTQKESIENRFYHMYRDGAARLSLQA